MDNVYYSPETWDLSVIGSLEEDMSYEFNILTVWQHQGGKVYYAVSSGCSCPTPFEEYTSLEGLEVLNKATWKNFENAVEGISCDVVDRVALLQKAKAAAFPVSKKEMDSAVAGLLQLAESLS